MKPAKLWLLCNQSESTGAADVEQILQSPLAEPQLALNNHRAGLEGPVTLIKALETANLTGIGGAEALQSSSLPTLPQEDLAPQGAHLALLEVQESPLVAYQMTQGTMTKKTTQQTIPQSLKGLDLGDALGAKAKADQGQLEQR